MPLLPVHEIDTSGWQNNHSNEQPAREILSLPHQPSTKIYSRAENDVIFGTKLLLGERGATTACKRVADILKENFEAHRDAKSAERRKIEKAIILRVRKELPPASRFLRFVPGSGSEKECYRLMSDKELLRALQRSFDKMRYCQTRREKTAAKKVFPRSAQSRDPEGQDSDEGIIFLKTIDGAAAASAHRHAKELDTSRWRNNKDYTEQPIREISNLQYPLNDSKANSKIQEPPTVGNHQNCRPPACSVVNDENAIKETNSYLKRSKETTPKGSRKRARLSLPDPPASSELTISTKIDPIEPKEELNKRPTRTINGMDSPEQDTHVSLKVENQQLREENEQLLEEIEQIKMNHAMEIGFMEGGSGDLSEENTNLKEDIAKARQIIKDLQGPTSESAELKQQLVEVRKELDTLRNGNRDLSITIERLQNKNDTLKRKIVGFQENTAKLERLQYQIAALEQRNVVLKCQLQAEDIMRELGRECQS